MRGECISGGPVVIAAIAAVQDVANVAALKVGEGLAENHCDDDDCYQEEEVQDGRGEAGQDVVEEEDGCDDCVDGCDAGLLLLAWLTHQIRYGQVERRTTVIVPIKMPGGFASYRTISAIKFAVIPIMATSEHA